ncbi:MAG: hypothetical protein HY816_04345 [Candidatus Wallbacteria bacterium]|nr:hypothetical protein [Candidatus Wallbacteria bacterium]
MPGAFATTRIRLDVSTPSGSTVRPAPAETAGTVLPVTVTVSVATPPLPSEAASTKQCASGAVLAEGLAGPTAGWRA